MKKRIVSLVSLLALSLLLIGCSKPETPDSLKAVRSSYLTDSESLNTLTEIMDRAGVPSQRQSVLLDHIRQFNESVSTEKLPVGFTSGTLMDPSYHPYRMQDEWSEANEDFFGYSCRITAFSLFADAMEIPADAEMRDNMVIMDRASLKTDPSALLNDDDMNRFTALYSVIPTEDTRDVAVHLKNLQEDWAQRGIVFHEQENMRLISVVIHDAWDDAHDLFIGHAGILFPQKDGTLYFLEKIAFQEPYRLIAFSSRTELNEYLMRKYDVQDASDFAPAFILENDQLMEGWQTLSQ